MVFLTFRIGFFRILALLVLTGFLCSCTPVRTKNIVDRVYELDPQGKIFVSKTLLENPPKTVAVLPFRSQIGEGRVEGSGALFDSLSRKDPSQPESVGERMRRAFFGQFAQLEFDHVKISRIDRTLHREGLDTWEKMTSLPPQRLGELLGADAIIIGEVTHFDYYYAFLYSQLAVGLSLEMIDTRTAEVLWRVHDARRDHTIRVVYDPIALVVGLFQVGFSMRPINMMRAMDEICRELVGTIPPPQENQ
jgi:Putative lipoprotein GNA1162-like